MNQKPGMSPETMFAGCLVVAVTILIWGICMVIWLAR